MTDDIAAPDGEPTGEEIRAECLLIQADWSPELEWSKRVEKLGEYTPPVGPRDEPRRGAAGLNVGGFRVEPDRVEDDDDLRKPEWWQKAGLYELPSICAASAS